MTENSGLMNGQKSSVTQQDRAAAAGGGRSLVLHNCSFANSGTTVPTVFAMQVVRALP